MVVHCIFKRISRLAVCPRWFEIATYAHPFAIPQYCEPDCRR